MFVDIKHFLFRGCLPFLRLLSGKLDEVEIESEGGKHKRHAGGDKPAEAAAPAAG